MFNNRCYLDFKKKVKRAFNFFLDIIFPIECLGCGQEGKWICADCQKQIPINLISHCLECKQETKFGEFCHKCEPNHHLNGVLIASDYNNELIKQAIKTLKYRFVPEIGQELGGLLILFLERQLAQIHSADWLNNFVVGKNFAPQVLTDIKNTLVMPVPLYPRRKRWRGFNQAEILARQVVTHFGFELGIKNLHRVRATHDQASLHERERRTNVANSFAWQGGALNGKHIILTDDVATTGSTLNACALVLKQAGAGEVWGLVVAKSL
ncbi:MAG: ComF family protein [Patescibacteria group bacterium]